MLPGAETEFSLCSLAPRGLHATPSRRAAADYPARTVTDHVKGIKECGVFNAKELQQVERENALTLFPRFKA